MTAVEELKQTEESERENLRADYETAFAALARQVTIMRTASDPSASASGLERALFAYRQSRDRLWKSISRRTCDKAS